jgi:hypothetical protein
MRLFGEFSKIEEQDDGTIKVYGIASSGARDDAGEVVTADAMKGALPGYEAFPALREMHGLSAAGRTLEASVDADGVTRIVAHVVDPLAITKVKTKVYAGFSIGGKVLERSKDDPTIITRLKLSEISLVDRPCNPEAVLDMWKADGATLEDQSMTTEVASGPTNDEVKAKAEDLAKVAGKPANWRNYVTKARAALVAEMEAAPEVDALEKTEGYEVRPDQGGFGLWTALAIASGNDFPVSIYKTEAEAWSAAKELAATSTVAPDPVEALAAALGKANAAIVTVAEPAAPAIDLTKTAAALRLLVSRADGVLSKGLYSVSRLAELIESLTWLQQSVAWEAEAERDGSTLPADLASSVAMLLTTLSAMVAEEAAEIVQAYAEDGMDLDFDPGDDDADVIAYASRLVDLAKADESLMQKVGARHSKADASNMQAAHDALAKLGAMCDPSNVPADETEKAALVADRDRLAKALADAAPQIDSLAKAMTEQGEQLAKAMQTIGELNARLEKVEATPAAPKGIVSNLRAISKVDDVNPDGGVIEANAETTAKAAAAYLANLSPEELGQLQLRASLSRPLTISR